MKAQETPMVGSMLLLSSLVATQSRRFPPAYTTFCCNSSRQASSRRLKPRFTLPRSLCHSPSASGLSPARAHRAPCASVFQPARSCPAPRASSASSRAPPCDALFLPPFGPCRRLPLSGVVARPLSGTRERTGRRSGNAAPRARRRLRLWWCGLVLDTRIKRRSVGDR